MEVAVGLPAILRLAGSYSSGGDSWSCGMECSRGVYLTLGILFHLGRSDGHCSFCIKSVFFLQDQYQISMLSRAPPEPETIFSLWLSWKVYQLILYRPLEFKSIGISAISFFVIEIWFFRISGFFTVHGYFTNNICQFCTVHIKDPTLTQNRWIFFVILYHSWNINNSILEFLTARLRVNYKFLT